ILFFNGPEQISSARERLDGYIRAHREQGVPYDAGRVHVIPVTATNYEPLREVLTQSSPSAIICFSDILALQTVRVLNRIRPGWKKNTVIAGFDNIKSFFPLPVSLISVGPAADSLGGRAAQTLLKLMRGEKVENTTVLHTRIFDE
ncbi:MAG: substrate-binding domain-containing protein, partial [Oscillospiraceae bacterium]|nr:substrate-binding domain-containing protein [Oscillospiraceae bacterium]